MGSKDQIQVIGLAPLSHATSHIKGEIFNGEFPQENPRFKHGHKFNDKLPLYWLKSFVR